MTETFGIILYIFGCALAGALIGAFAIGAIVTESPVLGLITIGTIVADGFWITYWSKRLAKW